MISEESQANKLSPRAYFSQVFVDSRGKERWILAFH